MTDHEKDRLAVQYLKRIRNPFKRSYGVKYWTWLSTGGQEPDYDDISYMAAQAVRMTLQDIKAGIKAGNWE